VPETGTLMKKMTLRLLVVVNYSMSLDWQDQSISTVIRASMETMEAHVDG
jgi:hypothetical protein